MKETMKREIETLQNRFISGSVIIAIAMMSLLSLTSLNHGCSDDDNGEQNLCSQVDCGVHATCDEKTGLCRCDTGYYEDNGICVEGECFDNADCDDGNNCNGIETCNENHECVVGDAIDCGDNAHCVDPEGSCECDEGFFLEGEDCVSDVITDFEDLTLEPESFWNGSDESGIFETGHATLDNFHDTEYGYWEGFAYSNTTDTSTPGYENQYSAVAEGGAQGSEIYGVGYYGTFYENPPPTVTFNNTDEGYTVSGLYVTNATYTYLAISEGDAVSKVFGGPDGDDPDWFLLKIHGLNMEGEIKSTVEFYLADFRFEDNVDDFIVQDWTWVDLTSLGPITGLQFTLSSSDMGDYGMNTPAYFAIDTIKRHGS